MTREVVIRTDEDTMQELLVLLVEAHKASLTQDPPPKEGFIVEFKGKIGDTENWRIDFSRNYDGKAKKTTH